MIREFLMVLIASCSFIAASESFAQPQWETSLTFVQNPSGSIDQWRSDSTLGTLTINNPYPTPRRIVITYQLTNRANGLVVLRGRTPPKDIKAFPTQTTLKNPDFLDSIGFRHYGRDNSKTTWIRAVPEGQYLLCLTIEPSSHETLVPDLCSKIQIGAGIDTSEDVQRQGSGFLWAGKVNSMLGAGI
ncbi:MAG: hypothetical protein Q8919_15440, partial [Bacteroidota bacterium]|nr:hypothetical protein [Bacteroidota bacterium]